MQKIELRNHYNLLLDLFYRTECEKTKDEMRWFIKEVRKEWVHRGYSIKYIKKPLNQEG